MKQVIKYYGWMSILLIGIISSFWLGGSPSSIPLPEVKLVSEDLTGMKALGGEEQMIQQRGRSGSWYK